MLTPKLFATTIACGALLAVSMPAFAGASKSDIQTFEQTKLSARDAVSAAEKTSGGKAMGVKFTTDNKKPVYDVTVLQASNNATKHYLVDADASMAAAREKTGVVSKVEAETQSERAAAKVAKIPLDDAIAKAEQNTGGKVINADLQIRGSTADYDTEVVKGGTSVMYTVDAGSGTVAPKK